MADAIRTIEKDTTHAEWARSFPSDEATWRFSDPPQRLGAGDLMFFAVHGLIQGVGTYVRISTKRNNNGLFTIFTTDNTYIADRDLEFKGYPGLRYLDVLPTQYDGLYKSLSEQLARYAKRYRAGERSFKNW